MSDYYYYKLFCKTDNSLCYVGSTKCIKKRMQKHKSRCYNQNDMPKYNTPIYKIIRDNGGWDNFDYIEIGYMNNITYAQSLVIEQTHISTINPSMNSQKAFLSEQERKDNSREYAKTYMPEYFYVRNRTTAAEKLLCECGLYIRRDYMHKHIKRPVHTQRLTIKTAASSKEDLSCH